jgi:RNase P/RNase MRP subunit p29
MNASLIAAFLGAMLFAAPQAASPDPDGFIRNWLVLAPIAIQEDSGATEIARDLLKGEATIKPRAGDTVTVDGKQLAWTPHQTSDYFIDFLQAFGKERGEDVAGYAVAYVLADEEMKVKLSIGSNDQARAWVNGKQVINFIETRTLEKDTDSGDVTLAKGQNVLVFKVINEKNNWQGCARFMKDGAPVKTIRISLTPQ